MLVAPTLIESKIAFSKYLPIKVDPKFFNFKLWILFKIEPETGV